MESNKTIKIKEYIIDVLSKGILHSLDEFQKEIFNWVAIRLFRKKELQKQIKILIRAKLPRLLEIISNESGHLIIETLKQKVIKEKNPVFKT